MCSRRQTYLVQEALLGATRQFILVEVDVGLLVLAEHPSLVESFVRDYACGLKHGDVIPTCGNLFNLFGYFQAIRICHAKLRYFDCDGQVHFTKDKTGGRQGDPLERGASGLD